MTTVIIKKTLISMMIIYFCFCMSGIAEEYVDVVTLLNQADHPWQKQYIDNYGRNIDVDVIPIISNVEKVPILMMDSPIISEENIYNAFPYGHISTSDQQGVEYNCIDEKSGANIYINIPSPNNTTFPTPECLDININYEFKDSGNSSHSPNLTVYDGFFALPYEIDFDTPYLGESELTVRESLDLIEKRLSALFPDYELQVDLFRFGLIKATNPYYSLAIRQSIYGIPVLMCSKDPVLNTSEEKLGIKPLKEWRSILRLQYGTFDKPSWIVKVSKTKFSILCRPLKIKAILMDDVPLCSMDKVIQTIENKIQTGYIRNVYSLRFGYCCYFNENEEIILYPVWEVECDYMFNPKKEMLNSKANTDNPVISRLYYRTMIVNAQTGEFMDPLERKERLLYCPKIITWEDVQS